MWCIHMRLSGETGGPCTETEKEPKLLKEHLCLCNQPLSTYSLHVHYGAGAGERKGIEKSKVYQADETCGMWRVSVDEGC